MKDTVPHPDTLCEGDPVKLELRVAREGLGVREGQEAVTEGVKVPPPRVKMEGVKDTEGLRLWVREAQKVALGVPCPKDRVGDRVPDTVEELEAHRVGVRVREGDTEAVMVCVRLVVVQGELVNVPESVKVKDPGGLPVLVPHWVVERVGVWLPLPQRDTLGQGEGEKVVVWVKVPLPFPDEGELQGLTEPLPLLLKHTVPEGVAVGHTLTVKVWAAKEPTGVGVRVEDGQGVEVTTPLPLPHPPAGGDNEGVCVVEEDTVVVVEAVGEAVVEDVVDTTLDGVRVTDWVWEPEEDEQTV